MKLNRSTKCSLKFATQSKLSKLGMILDEYGRVVNGFIDLFWEACPSKAELLKPVVDSVDSWFSARLRKVAAREAIDMIHASKKRRAEKARKPVHRGARMCVSSTTASLNAKKSSKEFDAYLHLSSIGHGVIFDLPIKFHKHYNKLAAVGKRLESYVITRNSVQFCFEIETGLKREPDRCVGIDTGIKALASTSTGKQFGKDIESGISRILRCEHGSKGQRKASRALRQRMDEVAKEVVEGHSLVVVERLKGITLNMKKTPRRRLGKNMRRVVGRWNVRYWLETLQRKCEDNRVAFRTVSPYYTSQTCSSCGQIDKSNRAGETYSCKNCGHTLNADINAAKNILARFLTGKYGSGCKPVDGHICLS